jgi:tRNA U34 5-methylaminomethyl-2-thiouridine-forming methyltransferase MnmC
MKRKLIKTADGSYTLYVPELDEHYHSIHGALQEANHVFIQHGLEPIKDRSSIRVLEMGLGTALNAYLSYQWARKNNITLWYSGVEAYPVEGEIITICLKEIGVNQVQDLRFFSEFIYGSTQVLDNFTLDPIHAFWADINFKEAYDVVFYDAFGPRAQSELWTLANFQIAFDALKPGGTLVTYCAKGQVKRDLKSVGFTVESRPGPPGKREMTVALKS